LGSRGSVAGATADHIPTFRLGRYITGALLSMKISEEDARTLVPLLSAERLGGLIALAGSDAIAIELHQENLSVGTQLMKVIATLEIALRNTVACNLAANFDVQNWLQQPPIGFHWKEPERSKISSALDSAKRAEYSKLTQAQKAVLDELAYPQGRPANTPHAKRAKDRRKRIQVTEGKVIAELTLYFWKRLYGPEYEQSLWRTTLKRTFPNKRTKRAEVAANLEVIYQSRNRLAHHEPVLGKRFSDTVDATKFIADALLATDGDQQTALSRLIEQDIAAVKATDAALRARLDAFKETPPNPALPNHRPH
jgi:predicted RNA methylase